MTLSLAQTTPQYIDPCLDPGFGHENGDGYVRILNRNRNDGGRLVMRHRWFWEIMRGPIPNGCEINHICGNRRCCNVNHLECIEGYHHTVMGNYNRYKDTIKAGCKMLYDGVPAEDVMRYTNRSRATINSWYRKGLVERYGKDETNI